MVLNQEPTDEFNERFFGFITKSVSDEAVHRKLFELCILCAFQVKKSGFQEDPFIVNLLTRYCPEYKELLAWHVQFYGKIGDEFHSYKTSGAYEQSYFFVPWENIKQEDELTFLSTWSGTSPLMDVQYNSQDLSLIHISEPTRPY